MAPNQRVAARSCRNNCTTRTPVIRSCRKALMRASRILMSRYASRTFFRKSHAAMNTRGRTANVTRASRQSMTSMAIMMKATVNTSPKIVTTPEVNISFRTSTSLVSRVIRRPTGFRSKYASRRRCRCRKISCRRSSITFCPIHVVRIVRPYSSSPERRSVTKKRIPRVRRAPKSPSGIAWSMTSIVSQGPTSASPEAATSISTAIATLPRYGLRYESRRFIRRASYAFPSASSSWRGPSGACMPHSTNSPPAVQSGWRAPSPPAIMLP